jgi:predicted RNA polymerase sigma factor
LQAAPKSVNFWQAYLLPAVHGHVLAALGRLDEAKAAFSAALKCDCTLPEKRFLQRQLAMVLTQLHSL